MKLNSSCMRFGGEGVLKALDLDISLGSTNIYEEFEVGHVESKTLKAAQNYNSRSGELGGPYRIKIFPHAVLNKSAG